MRNGQHFIYECGLIEHVNIFSNEECGDIYRTNTIIFPGLPTIKDYSLEFWPIFFCSRPASFAGCCCAHAGCCAFGTTNMTLRSSSYHNFVLQQWPHFIEYFIDFKVCWWWSRASERCYRIKVSLNMIGESQRWFDDSDRFENINVCTMVVSYIHNSLRPWSIECPETL